MVTEIRKLRKTGCQNLGFYCSTILPAKISILFSLTVFLKPKSWELLEQCNPDTCPAIPNSLWPHGVYPSKFQHPWNFLGKNIEVGCHFFLQALIPNDPGIKCSSPLSPELQADSLPSWQLEHLNILWTICHGWSLNRLHQASQYLVKPADWPGQITSTVHELWTSRCSSWIQKRQRNQRSSCQHPLDHWKCKRIPENIFFCFIDCTKAIDGVDQNKLWKILQEMGIPDHLTCLLRNLHEGQEATVRTDHGTTQWFQTGKGVGQGCILSLCLFNWYAEYIMWNAELDESQAGIKIARRNINNHGYTDDASLMAESEEELKSHLIKVKEDEKTGLKLNIQKTKVIASSLITSWQTDGETMETITDFIFLDSKITADGDCSHEVKRHLLFGRKAMTNLDSILKSRDITLPTKVCLVTSMVFSVVMYGCENWTIKKTECWRIDAFELQCWRRHLRVSWTERRSN